MATNKPISAFPTLSAANVQPADELVIVDVSDTSSASTGTTKNITLAAALNNPQNGIVTGQFVPQLGTAFVGGIVKTAQNGIVFQSPGGSLTDFSFLTSTGLFVAGMRASDVALMGGKLMGVSAVPSVSALTAAGVGATVSVIGNNTSGLVTLITGSSGVVPGNLVTLTFSNAYSNGVTAIVQYWHDNSTTGTSFDVLYTASSATAFTFGVLNNGCSTGSTYKFNYVVIGYGN